MENLIESNLKWEDVPCARGGGKLFSRRRKEYSTAQKDVFHGVERTGQHGCGMESTLLDLAGKPIERMKTTNRI